MFTNRATALLSVFAVLSSIGGCTANEGLNYNDYFETENGINLIGATISSNYSYILL